MMAVVKVLAIVFAVTAIVPQALIAGRLADRKGRPFWLLLWPRERTRGRSGVALRRVA
jgi:MFS family permease